MAVQLPRDLDARIKAAVQHFWGTRATQKIRQQKSGHTDQGNRGTATGGKHLDGFVDLCARLIQEAGMPPASIFTRRSKQVVPGFFRATKQWDMLVVHKGQLICAMEAKSQVGSFGNNGNNRAEEALGNALDLWTAHRERMLGGLAPPWLGYLFILEDAPDTRTPIRTQEPHFKVRPEFKDASYAKRIELLCQKLLLEKQYTAAALLMSTPEQGAKGLFTEPIPELSFRALARSLVAHVAAHSP